MKCFEKKSVYLACTKQKHKEASTLIQLATDFTLFYFIFVSVINLIFI